MQLLECLQVQDMRVSGKNTLFVLGNTVHSKGQLSCESCTLNFALKETLAGPSPSALLLYLGACALYERARCASKQGQEGMQAFQNIGIGYVVYKV